MLNPLRFTNITHLARPEPAKALLDAASTTVAPAATPKAAVLDNIARVDRGITLQMEVVTAAIARLPPEPPPAQTLQDKVRAARRRLVHRSLLGKSGLLLDSRANLVLLRSVLQVNV